MGKSLVTMGIVISGSCVFRIFWVLTVFAYFQTIESLYLVYFFSWSITALFENWYFVRCYRRIIKYPSVLHHRHGEGGKNPAAGFLCPEGKLWVPLHRPQKFLIRLPDRFHQTIL